MVNFTLYERMLELPLFQGMSRNDLEQAVMSTKFRTLTYAKGKKMISEGDACDKLLFLLEGSMSTTSTADDKSYSITEIMSAPDIVQPERLFGLTQRHSMSFVTREECHFICLWKKDVTTLSDKYEIFRINLLNIICAQSQRLTRSPWRVKPRTIRGKIARFIETRCLRPAGEKTLRIKMERLSDEIGESRLNVSRELKALEQAGLIETRRGEIKVKALEKLINEIT